MQCGCDYSRINIANCVLLYARRAIMNTLRSKFRCSEMTCSLTSNRVVSIRNGGEGQSLKDDHCENAWCDGMMQREFPASKCYLELCYAIAVLKFLDMSSVRERVENLKKRLKYSYIQLSLFK